jgi:hypothetical protein
MYLLSFNLKIGERLNGKSPQNKPNGESFTSFFGLGRRK